MSKSAFLVRCSLGIVGLLLLHVYDLIGRSVWHLVGGKELFKWERYFATGVSQIGFAAVFLYISFILFGLFQDSVPLVPPILYAVAGVLNLLAAKKSKQ